MTIEIDVSDEDWLSQFEDCGEAAIGDLRRLLARHKLFQAYTGGQLFMSDFRTADDMRKAYEEARAQLRDLRRAYDELRRDWNHLKPYKMYKALREIASCESHVPGDVVDVARKALPDEELG